MQKWVNVAPKFPVIFLSFFFLSFLFCVLSVVLLPTVYDPLTHSIYLDGGSESKWVWQGCHVCSRKGQQRPVQRQEVSYPYISLCFCHQLDSPSLSFSVTLYLSPILFCPLCLASLPVLHSHCHTSQLLSSLPLQISVNPSTLSQNACISLVKKKKLSELSFLFSGHFCKSVPTSTQNYVNI